MMMLGLLAGSMAAVKPEMRIAVVESLDPCRGLRVKKGDTVGQFLSAVRQQLQPEFREMRATSVENIMYVKEGTRRHLLLPAVLRAPSVRAAVGGTVQRERGPPNLLRPCPGRVVLRVETCR